MKSIRPVDREMFMSGRYELKKLVAEKKRIYFEVELTNLQICDLSVILGTFLNLCKLAKLKPLFEKRFGLEKNVHDQTSAYLTQYKIFYNYYSGFRSNHLTDLFHLYLHSKILKGFHSCLLTSMV